MDLSIEVRDDYLFSTVSGRLSLSEALEIYKRVLDASAEKALGKVLFDCLAVEGELPLLQRYELGKAMAEYGVSRSIMPKIAVIGLSPTITGFAAKVAWNRGLVVEVFSDRQAALVWLNSFRSRTTILLD